MTIRSSRLPAVPLILHLAVSFAFAGAIRFDQATDAVGTWGAQVNPRATVLGNSATLEAWVAFSNVNSAFGEFYSEWALAFEDKHLRLGPSRIEGFLLGASAAGDLVATPSMGLNRWYHVAYVYTGSEESIYVNGTRLASRAASGNIMDYPRPGENPQFNEGYAGLGAYRRPSLSPSFEGVVESIRVSSSARYTGDSFVVPHFGDFENDATTVSLMNFEEAPGSEFVTAVGPGGFTGRLGTIIPGPNGTQPTLLSSYDALLPGDFNEDGAVDAADYTVWRDALGTPAVGQADADADGDVDGRDYAIWRSFYASQPGAESLHGFAAPEPGGVSLFALAIGFAACSSVRRVHN
ncbi:LamG domain-containing protein [Botrimarina mediterranea]|uniref:LamG-like jellyroll fold domain-containing protein n=1 Tax=Botrimarina mediterranea TaxID=2528022 RepID=A0A518K9Q5_9BACT|nr:LamG domain-containing protein [Botrimarina mediterranea]QDV74524.1 hypothetical protein Spa11_27280 [Botrimarina mediterranea]QDV79164.1 hypothetical protein K2D_27750 [Planctomycetes bacterium K2D]